MAERRVAEIMRQRQRLGEILVERQRARQRTCHLRHLETVGQTRPIVIAFVIDEHLGLVFETAEGGRMDDAVAVALERCSGRALGLGMKPPTAKLRARCERREASGRT